jgi:23S rRNA (adenine2503-C2)-methyltransferase
MGMGEPLMNWKAVDPAHDSERRDGLGIGARHYHRLDSWSSAGIIALSERKEQFPPRVIDPRADDELRQKLMPINTKYPLADVIEAPAHSTGASRSST